MPLRPTDATAGGRKTAIGEGGARGDSHATRADGDASPTLPFQKRLRLDARTRLSGLWYPAMCPAVWLCHAAMVGGIVSHALSCIVRFAGVKTHLWYKLRCAGRTHDMGLLHKWKEASAVL